MYSMLRGLWRNVVIARADKSGSTESSKIVSTSDAYGSFQPTSTTTLSDDDTEWELPDGLEELTAVLPRGELGLIRHSQLSEKFEAVVYKRLSSVECDPKKSHQHEFNGTTSLRLLFGEDDRKHIPAQFVRVDSEFESTTAAGALSWYDARRKHPTRTEYRLYYQGNQVTKAMKASDVFILAMTKDGSALVITMTPDSPIKDQLFWLFGLEGDPADGFEYKAVTAGRILKWAVF